MRPIAIAALAGAAAVILPGMAAADDIKIPMMGNKFEKPQIAAKVGDTLVFENHDQVDHNVFVPTAGFGVNPGGTKPGQATSLPMGKAGTFEVECVFHADMVAKVTVTK